MEEQVRAEWQQSPWEAEDSFQSTLKSRRRLILDSCVRISAKDSI